YNFNLKARIELNDPDILLNLVRQSNLVTVLAEASIHNERGVKAVPIDIPDNEMVGCVHTLEDSYRKHSMLEFIKMLCESVAVRERINWWLYPCGGVMERRRGGGMRSSGDSVQQAVVVE
ncbi:MAG: hypothetical protein K1V74_06130, partial [Muribaculaceae bacterium]